LKKGASGKVVVDVLVRSTERWLAVSGRTCLRTGLTGMSGKSQNLLFKLIVNLVLFLLFGRRGTMSDTLGQGCL
jgi:hypothetical protein